MQACTAVADETRKNQSQLEHHSATDPIIAAGVREADQPSQQEVHQLQCNTQHIPSETPRTEPTRAALEKPIRKVKVKWPKANDKDAWRSFDQTLCTTLQGTLRGSITSKLNILGHLIYEEGKEQFGEMPQSRAIPKQSGKTREISQLVKERRLLQKQ